LSKTSKKNEGEWPLSEGKPTEKQIKSWFSFDSRCLDAVTMANGEFIKF
jgi:hypothetical protein